jgi:hypothetical protein
MGAGATGAAAAGELSRGGLKKKTMYVRTLFGQDWTFVHARRRDFFYRVFEFALSRNAQKRTTP